MRDEVLIEEQHPIPQQISSFQFRLVGDMTLKQFFQLAGGAIVALIIYASSIPPFVKWPLIFLFFGLGAALAFLPLEDRPLATWILIFFKSIYSPTLFTWNKMAQLPQYFQPEEGAPALAPAQPEVKPEKEITPTPQAKLEEKEQSFLSRVTKIMRFTQAAPSTKKEPAPTIATGVAPVLPVEPPKEEKKKPETDVKPLDLEEEKDIKKKEEKEEVMIPQTGVVTVEPIEKSDEDISEGPSEPITTSAVKPTLSSDDQEKGKQAKFSQEAAPPIPPTKPNTIAGQVVDPDGKIVEGAILEIKDSEGRPVRALKSNRLGHFMIVTPLLEGKYTVLTEKDGLLFDPIAFMATGELIPPIAIWAKERTETKEAQTVDVTQIYGI